MKLFKTHEVLKIAGIPQRRLTNLIDKGVVVPHIQARGAGNPSSYSYLNCLEICLAETLFQMGLSLHLVRDILQTMRDNRHLEDWADNYSAYFKNQIEVLRKLFFDSSSKEWTEKEISSVTKGEKPLGTMFYFYSKSEFFEPTLVISPYDLARSLGWDALHPDHDWRNSRYIVGAIIVNLGNIRNSLDDAIVNLGG